MTHSSQHDALISAGAKCLICLSNTLEHNEPTRPNKVLSHHSLLFIFVIYAFSSKNTRSKGQEEWNTTERSGVEKLIEVPDEVKYKEENPLTDY